MHHGYYPRGGGGAPKTNQQAQRANQITAQQGLGDRVSFQVAGGCCCCACRRLPPLPRWQAGGLGSTDVHAAG